MRAEKNNTTNIKAQVWFMDFVVAMVIFSFVLISYYLYTTNISKQDYAAMDTLVSDAKTISSTLTTGGSPDGWDSENVEIIGFTDNYNRIDNEKFNEFMKINYNKTKKLLGTTYDYLLFFVNESGDVQNVEGYCGTDIGEVEIIYDVAAAYYYKAPGDDDEFLFEFMHEDFRADIYTEDGDEAGVTGDYEALGDNLDSYGFVVIEAPEWSKAKFEKVKTEFNDWVGEKGGFLMISGELVSAQKKQMVGGEFKKESGLSSSEEYATVVNEDEYLKFVLTAGLIFKQAFSVKDKDTANFKDIARFNESELLFEDIRYDNKIAIARWEYGEGKVFFFSDFDAEYFEGDFQEILEVSTSKWIGAICLPVDISNIGMGNLVKTERMVIHNSDLLKMVLYLWE